MDFLKPIHFLCLKAEIPAVYKEMSMSNENVT